MSTRAKETFLRELDDLLAQPVAFVLQMEAGRFDELAGSMSQSLVLFGAGGLGRKTLAGLRTLGIEPLAFTDNNQNIHGYLVDGIQVLSPEQAAQKFGKRALFVITVYTDSAPGGIEPIIEKLNSLGCVKVISFASLFWKYPDIFLPHYAYDLPHKVIDAADFIRDVAAFFTDPISQKEYLGQIQWRLNPQIAPIASQSKHAIYFPPELILLSPEEVFVDCGAYTGDTVRSFIKQSAGEFRKLIAYEPDPRNYTQLKALVSSLPEEIASRIQIADLALGTCSEQLHFNAQGVASSARSENGEIVVQSEPLDSLLGQEAPTYIKMDIEGAEMDALRGATESIRRHLPILAISVYHCQDHLWTVPSWIHSISERYSFYLRRYTPRVLDDLVLYAIPSHRSLSSQYQNIGVR